MPAARAADRPGHAVGVFRVGRPAGVQLDARWALAESSTPAGAGGSAGIPARAGHVTAGWDQSMQGGGRRQQVIPPGPAYGDCGAGHAVATGETLIFVCDLVSV